MRGFTLTELLVIIAIVSIVVTTAIPGYKNFMRNQKASGIASNLAGALRLAKSEAVANRQTVTLCAVPANQSISNSSDICSNSTTDWVAWKVFLDVNGNGDDAVSGDTTIQQFGDLTAGSITASSAGSVVFDSVGFITSGAKTFTIVPSGCTGNNARSVTANITGSIEINIVSC